MSVRVLQGHVLDVLAGLPAGSVHACVTSPPYWMLRNYGSPPQVWPDGWVGELGQEDTPERFVDHLVAVFRAVKRVLRDDGTLWVNLAGCFWNDAGGQNGAQGTISPKAIVANGQQGRTRKRGHPVYKALDYVDVPGLVARALQADGWLWRSDVALVKSAPMPESVSGTRFERCRVKRSEGDQSPGTGQRKVSAVRDGQHGNRDVGSFESQEARAEWADCPGCPRCAPHGGLVLRRGSGRPTRAWERLLVFAKKPGYYYDTEAVREPHAEPGRGNGEPESPNAHTRGGTLERGPTWVPSVRQYHPAGRNARDWLLWRPQPLKAEGDEAEHYAAFPHFLPELAIKAGTSARGCCPGCGAPWARVVERTEVDAGSWSVRAGEKRSGAPGAAVSEHSVFRTGLVGETTTLDWRPTCACPPREPVPCTVMDCFGGSGTSGIVADRLGRDAVLVELKPAYAKLAERRLHRDAPLLMWGRVTLEQSTTRSVPEGVPLPLEALEEPV